MSWGMKVDTIQNFVWIDNAFTKEECEQIVKLGYSQPLSDGLVFRKSGTEMESNDNIRTSNVRFLPADNDSSWIYRRFTDIANDMNNQYFNFDLWGFHDQLQFTEYKPPHGEYQFHIDRGLNIVPRKLSLALQLSDPEEYEGGEFEIFVEPKPTKVKREQGVVVVFPSYVLHRVAPVTSGVRNSLVGWVAGNQFK